MMLSSRRVCPRCACQVGGWMVNENGYVHCILCGFVSYDPGYRGTSFKMIFANIRDYPDDDLHHTSRKKEDYPSPALGEINNSLESCCRKHGGEAGRLPICKECEQRYDALAEKSVDDRIDSTDILDSFRFKQEAMLK